MILAQLTFQEMTINTVICAAQSFISDLLYRSHVMAKI